MAEATRRAVLAGGVALGASPLLAVIADIKSSADGQIKMEACLDGHPAIWSYAGFVYAVRPDERPRALFAIAGGSTSWARRAPDGGWRMSRGDALLLP